MSFDCMHVSVSNMCACIYVFVCMNISVSILYVFMCCVFYKRTRVCWCVWMCFICTHVCLNVCVCFTNMCGCVCVFYKHTRVCWCVWMCFICTHVCLNVCVCFTNMCGFVCVFYKCVSECFIWMQVCVRVQECSCCNQLLLSLRPLPRLLWLLYTRRGCCAQGEAAVHRGKYRMIRVGCT